MVSIKTEETKVINDGHPLASQDYALIINTYEKESTKQVSEEAALVTHYKDVYSTRNFSERTRDQMNYYPGIHQDEIQNADPSYVAAMENTEDRLHFWDNAMDNPSSFMSAMRSTEQDFDYTEVFGTDASAEERAKNLGKILTECVPCFGRKLSSDELLPNGNLLDVHLTNIKGRLDFLDDIINLFNDPGSYIDICELLNLLSHQCPADLLAMQILLSQMLAKINLDTQFNIDFITNLVGPILSPFLDALGQWLDKWIQVILEPMLCVVDNINETIVTAQQAKIPFSEANVGIEADLGVFSSSGEVLDYSPGSGWSSSEVDRLKELDNKQYRESRPELPDEEIEGSLDEIEEAWNPSLSEAEREQRDEKWQELRNKNTEKVANRNRNLEQKLNYPSPTTEGYYPPEQQPSIKNSNYYLNVDPLLNSVVQLRNILQSSNQYVSDWFAYVTQMIYDLLGTDIGWMQKKTGSSIQKVKLIQFIFLIKSILEAYSKNGLRCGENSNFDENQMRFIFDNSLSKFSTTKFEMLDDGTIKVTPPGRLPDPTIEDSSTPSTVGDSTNDIQIGVELDPVEITDEIDEQKITESGIIVKNCLNNLSSTQFEDAKSWIAEYERRSNG